MEITYILLSMVISAITTVSVNYFTEKGKNYATKQDIYEIKKNEEIAIKEIANLSAVEDGKRELKHKSILDSLRIIDCYLSVVIRNSTRQYGTVEEVRACFNNLILACEDSDLPNLFIEILLMVQPDRAPKVGEVLLKVDEYRNLSRKELGFGKLQTINLNNLWFSSVNFEKKNS